MYYIFIFYHSLHFPFTIYYHLFQLYYIIYYNLQFGNICYHLFHYYKWCFYLLPFIPFISRATCSLSCWDPWCMYSGQCWFHWSVIFKFGKVVGIVVMLWIMAVVSRWQICATRTWHCFPTNSGIISPRVLWQTIRKFKIFRGGEELQWLPDLRQIFG